MPIKPPSFMTWLKSPYILCALIGIATLYFILCNADTHFTEADKEPCYITYSEPVEATFFGIGRPNEEIPAGTKLRLFGKWGHYWFVEDTANGMRFNIEAPKDAVYTAEGSDEALKRKFDSQFSSYVKADNISDIFKGMNIKDIVKRYGDYTTAIPSEGIYYFRYLTPLVDGTRYESGLELHTDADGTVESASVPEDSYTTSNLFHILPFYSTICSWNLATHGVINLYDKSSGSSKEESSGFFGTIFGWIAGLVIGILKFGLLLVIIFLIFALPSLIIATVTGPMIHMKNVSSSTLNIINYAFTIPLEYIILISLTDYFHDIWLVMFPLMVIAAITAVNLPSMLTTGRRCSNCNAVDSIESKYKVIDVRQRVEYETVTHESDKAKYKGYSLRRMQHEWAQNVSYNEYKITITETDTQRDWHCTKCGASGTNVTTSVKKKRELIDSGKNKRIWTEKKSILSDIFKLE